MTIAYEKMASAPSKVSILNRLQKVDYRVWYFGFIVGSIVYDITKIEYLLQFGFKVNTIHIPLYLFINAFLMWTAISNNVMGMKIVKVYSVSYRREVFWSFKLEHCLKPLFQIMLLLFSTIITVLSPVWMFYEFNNGAPQHIRVVLEHGDNYLMGFGQSLAYCIYFELLLIMDVGCEFGKALYFYSTVFRLRAADVFGSRSDSSRQEGEAGIGGRDE